jgi:hypothetical protein
MGVPDKTGTREASFIAAATILEACAKRALLPLPGL